MKKKIRKLAACLTITAAITANAVAVSAETGFKLMIDGKETSLNNPVIYSEGYNLAPMGEILRLLGAEVSWEPVTKTVTASREENVISVTVGSMEATVNGAPVTLDIAARIVDDVTYVPVGFIAKSLGYTVGWSADTKTVTLDTPSAEKGRLDVSFKQRYERNLTLTEANARALSQSKDLKTLRSTMEDLRDSRDDLAKQSHLVGINTSNLPDAAANDLTSTIRTTLSSLEAMQTSLLSEPYQREIYNGALALSVKASFMSIENAQSTIALTNAQIELSKKSLENSKLMLDLGMMSAVDYEKAEFEHKKLVASQDTNERALETEYIALNKVLAYDSDTRYNIVIDNEYSPLDSGFVLDNYATRMASASPSIKISELSLKKAEDDLKLLTGTSLDYQKAKTAVNTASLELEDAKRAMEKNIRDAYYSLRDLETSIEKAEIDLKKAATDVETAYVQFETGGITDLQLKQIMYAHDALEISIKLMKESYGVSKFRFEHPYLL